MKQNKMFTIYKEQFTNSSQYKKQEVLSKRPDKFTQFNSSGMPTEQQQYSIGFPQYNMYTHNTYSSPMLPLKRGFSFDLLNLFEDQTWLQPQSSFDIQVQSYLEPPPVVVENTETDNVYEFSQSGLRQPVAQTCSASPVASINELNKECHKVINISNEDEKENNIYISQHNLRLKQRCTEKYSHVGFNNTEYTYPTTRDIEFLEEITSSHSSSISSTTSLGPGTVVSFPIQSCSTSTDVSEYTGGCMEERLGAKRRLNPCSNTATTKKKLGFTSSRYNGVCWNKRKSKWRARLSNHGTREFLGDFDTEVEAAKAFDARIKELYSPKKCLEKVNFINGELNGKVVFKEL